MEIAICLTCGENEQLSMTVDFASRAKALSLLGHQTSQSQSKFFFPQLNNIIFLDGILCKEQ